MFHRPRTDIKDTVQPKIGQPADVGTEQMREIAPVVRESVLSKSAEAPSQPQTQPMKQMKAKEEKFMQNDQSDSRDTETRSIEPPAAAPFQRPPHMQRSVPGGFPGSYGAVPHSSPYDHRGSGSDERRLVIGPGITLSGEIEACDYLLVEGTLEAALKGAKVLDVATTGTFYGAVEIEEATIGGRFEGELTVNGRLTIKSGGSVTGSIAYKELMVEAGATLDGKVSPLAPVSSARSDAPIRPTKPMAPRNDNSGRDDADELPFSGSRSAAE